jgi:uncharacterized membrane protein YeaQ/YmgE (transglycosylase-associated protein family)
MNIIISLIIGALMGLIFSFRMGTDREGLIRNIAVATVGAYGAGWLTHTMLESVPESVSFGVIIASSLGAVSLLLLVHRLGRA